MSDELQFVVGSIFRTKLNSATKDSSHDKLEFIGHFDRVGSGVTSAVLPHHRTYGSVYGGSQSKLEATLLFQQ